ASTTPSSWRRRVPPASSDSTGAKRASSRIRTTSRTSRQNRSRPASAPSSPRLRAGTRPAVGSLRKKGRRALVAGSRGRTSMLQTLRSRLQSTPATALVALLCSWLAAPGGLPLFAQETNPQENAADSAPLSADQLDALVAPIALYPDPLLANCLAASTYPVDILDA